MRRDIFYHGRKEPVDVLRYLPRFLANDPYFKKIEDVLSREHESYRLKLVDISKQFYVETATWGLRDWEEFLKIKPAKNASEDLRRAVIRVKRRGDTVMTLSHTQKVLEDLAPYGEVEIQELGENRLKLIIHNGNFYWEELLETLWTLLPAHLTFDFGIYLEHEHALNVGLAEVDGIWEHQDLTLDDSPLEAVVVRGQYVDLDEERFELGADSDSHIEGLSAAVLEQESEYVEYDCDRGELDDEESAAAFERYLRARWLEYKRNPVIEHYLHNNHGLDEGELDGPEEFPLDEEFLRIYWGFGCNRTDKYHVRYQTIYNPREDVTGRELRGLSELGVAGRILLHSKRQLATTGIIRALYVNRRTEKII